MTNLRGIHYEISKPVLNERDGYYQRRRQVDGQGNLVGTGEERIRLPKPHSTDGQYIPSIDLSKLGTMGGDLVSAGLGAIMRKPGAAARGTAKFIKDVQGGLLEDYKSWSGTDTPWEHGDIPAPSFDGRSSLDIPFAGAPVSNTLQGNRNALASPLGSEGPIGPVSGKPMRFPFAPIFDTQWASGGTSASDRPTALDDLIWNGVGLRKSSLDPNAAPSDQIASINRNEAASPSLGLAPASAPPLSQNPPGPLSLNDAYLEYLKRLNATQAQ